MVGRQVNFKTEKIDAKPKEEVTFNETLLFTMHSTTCCKRPWLTVRAGELFGIAGYDGRDKVIIESDYWFTKSWVGSMAIKGKEITNWPVEE